MSKAIFMSLAFIGLAGPAITQEVCERTRGPDHCNAVIACFEGRSVALTGRALGVWSGEIVAELTDGSQCTGSWEMDYERTAGGAEFDCDDGTNGYFVFLLDRPETASIYGRGHTNSGDMISAKTGDSAEVYRTPTGDLDVAKACGLKG